MRQRHVVACLYLFAAFYIVSMVACGLVMYHLRHRHERLPFVEPVIWHDVHLDDGEEQLKPDI